MGWGVRWDVCARGVLQRAGVSFRIVQAYRKRLLCLLQPVVPQDVNLDNRRRILGQHKLHHFLRQPPPSLGGEEVQREGTHLQRLPLRLSEECRRLLTALGALFLDLLLLLGLLLLLLVLLALLLCLLLLRACSLSLLQLEAKRLHLSLQRLVLLAKRSARVPLVACLLLLAVPRQPRLA